MSFAKHLFISYAHIDNQPLTPKQQGWITRFHAQLEAILEMRIGGKTEIWRDEKLQGNDIFADEIVDQFAQTAVLVSITVGRPVARPPPYRSPRAELPHGAPQSYSLRTVGDNVILLLRSCDIDVVSGG